MDMNGEYPGKNAGAVVDAAADGSPPPECFCFCDEDEEDEP